MGLVVGGEVEVGAAVTGAAVVGAIVGAAWAVVVGGCRVVAGAAVVTGAAVEVGATVVVDTVEVVVSDPLAATAVPRVVDPVEVRLPLLPQAAATNNRPAATNSTAVRRLIIGSLRPGDRDHGPGVGDGYGVWHLNGSPHPQAAASARPAAAATNPRTRLAAAFRPAWRVEPSSSNRTVSKVQVLKVV